MNNDRSKGAAVPWAAEGRKKVVEAWANREDRWEVLGCLEK